MTATDRPVYVEPVKRRGNGSGHWYVDGTGEHIPGVTTLIKGFTPPGGLINWAGNVVADYAIDHWDSLAELPISERHNRLRNVRSETSSAAMLRGTQVHAIAEKLVSGVEVDVSDEHRGRVQACARFLDDWDIQPPYDVESTVYNLTHGWAGTIDLLAVPGDGDYAMRHILIDYKNSSSARVEHALQLAAYAHAEKILTPVGEPVRMPMVEAAVVVLLSDDGYRVVPVDITDDTYKIFRHGMVVARLFKREDDAWKARRSGKDGPPSLLGETLYPEVVG